MFRFTLMNHLCRDLEQVHDTTRPPDRIRQDVSRSPGGDSRIFLNNCIGCHSGMDPLAQAFAYYNFDETAGRMRLHRRASCSRSTSTTRTTFQPGFVTPDDRWDNYWRAGQNALLGWDARCPAGARREVHGPGTRQQRRLRALPGREGFRKRVPAARRAMRSDRARVHSMVSSFRADGYRLKRVFAETAAYCMGE